MKLLVVIVNYRTADHVRSRLPKLMRELDTIAASVVIVDNASGDGSPAKLRSEVERQGWSDRVWLVEAGRNAGFAAGNNLALRWAADHGLLSEYVLLLNPDAHPEPGAVQLLLEFMDRHPSTAVAGPAVRSSDGTRGHSVFKSPSAIGDFVETARIGVIGRLFSRWSVVQPAPPTSVPSDWVSGCCMVLRRRAFEEIGLFDEGFFLYFEEVDLCRRARERGWGVHWVKEASVVHDEGASTNLWSCTRRRPRYWFDSRRRYFLKAGGRLGLCLANGGWLAGAMLHRLRHLTLRPQADPPHLISDFVRWTILQPRSVDGGVG